jgi:hypothetical protein
MKRPLRSDWAVTTQSLEIGASAFFPLPMSLVGNFPPDRLKDLITN